MAPFISCNGLRQFLELPGNCLVLSQFPELPNACLATARQAYEDSELSSVIVQRARLVRVLPDATRTRRANWTFCRIIFLTFISQLCAVPKLLKWVSVAALTGEARLSIDGQEMLAYHNPCLRVNRLLP